MIVRYANDIAALIGMELSGVSLVDGQKLGCKDYHLLNISSKGRLASVLVHQTDLVHLNDGLPTPRLELTIRRALQRIQGLLNPGTSGN